jgi:hypothetical protein
MNRLPQDFHPPGVTFLTDVSAGRWVEEALNRQHFGYLDAILPRRYSDCARIFHPAEAYGGHPVRWSEVAAWAGTVVHPLMAFEGISVPRPGFGVGNQPWTRSPIDDQMDLSGAVALARILAGFTGTPERCYFGIWEGFSAYFPGGIVSLTYGRRGVPQNPPPEVITAQRLNGVHREYLLYEGPLENIGAFFNHFRSHPPNLWWPEDRAWCVATEIYFNSTYVGGSQDCVEAIVGHPALEAIRVAPDAYLAYTADTINLGNRGP